MSKLSLKIIAISLLMFPLNIQAGWCMENDFMGEAEKSLNSAARKVSRIIQKKDSRHTFEQETLQMTLGAKGKRGSADWTCKNCKQLKSNCYGFGGGRSEEITGMAKQLQLLLENMEGQK